MPNFLDKEKCALHHRKLQPYYIVYYQSQWLKPYVEFNTEKNGGKDRKAFYKLMKNAL